jgi:DNA-binding CsgD family transcriptional regulator
MTLNGKCKNSITLNDNFLLSKISDITTICDRSKKLMVSIYHIEKDYFIYYNRTLKKKLGDTNNLLLKKGWGFWFSMIDSTESLRIKNRVLRFFSTSQFQNTLVLRYHITNFCNKKRYLRHEILFHKLGKQTIAINYFFDVSDKEKIEDYFETKAGLNGKKQITVSTREKEVLQLIADGFSSKQIADKLFISNHTAITHRKNLINKFKVKNTAQLISMASKGSELW